MVIALKWPVANVLLNWMDVLWSSPHFTLSNSQNYRPLFLPSFCLPLASSTATHSIVPLTVAASQYFASSFSSNRPLDAGVPQELVLLVFCFLFFVFGLHSFSKCFHIYIWLHISLLQIWFMGQPVPGSLAEDEVGHVAEWEKGVLKFRFPGPIQGLLN